MHRLDANGAIPHALEPALLRIGRRALPSPAPLLATVDLLAKGRCARKGGAGLGGGRRRREDGPGGAGKVGRGSHL